VGNLIEKTQREAVQDKAGGSGLSFSFAKVWAARKDELEEVVEEDQTDSWAHALQRLNEQKQMDHNRQLAESGRGVRRRAADIAKASVISHPDLARLLSFWHYADQNA
jgi:chromodomain-helicase-DNA-binding protein 4